MMHYTQIDTTIKNKLYLFLSWKNLKQKIVSKILTILVGRGGFASFEPTDKQ